MANLTALEAHLATRSYIEGYTPSQADVVVFKAIAAAPRAETNPHVARWYTHIQSYAAEHASLPGSSTAGESFLGESAPAAAAAAPAAGGDDDEIDLFGSDDEDDAEAERIKAERVAAYNEKKANKPKPVAKSVVTLEVKPWDDETDMVALEAAVRSIEKDGLVWGSSKLVPIGYGIRKLQVTLVVEDEKISLDELQEQIAEFEDYVQSTDVAAMQRTSKTWDLRSGWGPAEQEHLNGTRVSERQYLLPPRPPPSMLSPLECIPHDVLLHIALLAALSGPGIVAPDLLSLLLTSRTLHAALARQSSPNLYAAVFRRTFSDAAGHTDGVLAAELVQRCRAIRRCTTQDVSPRGLRQDLWTLLWTLLGDDGCHALLPLGRLPECIAKLALLHLREDALTSDETKGLIAWLLCLSLTRGMLFSISPARASNVARHSLETRNALVGLARPLISVPAITGASAAAAAGEEPVLHFNQRYFGLSPPAPSDGAIIVTFALKEAVALQVPHHLPPTRAIATAEHRTGPTTEDYLAFQRTGTRLFSDVRAEVSRATTTTATTTPAPSAATLTNRVVSPSDPWFVQTLSTPDGRPAAVSQPYASGLLVGLWEGSLMISSYDDDADADNDKSSGFPDYLCRTPMQCYFSEYHCSAPQCPLSLDYDLLQLSPDPYSPELAAYQEVSVPLSAPASGDAAILDRIIFGQTLADHEEAWSPGGFKFAGRVDDNGEIAFSRRAKHDTNERSETWIFRGRVRYGTAFVGTFRSSDEAAGVRGIFSLRKKH
ncbi:unnamed protein product [Mycena citricolor]|uniref:Elongation factor 1-beta n=1 Tax=Mycena citricolor TaxID=2018698 RepID=A0AAD2K008_9AGAR|nr:unnamed protein product [Mycena citricolor]